VNYAKLLEMNSFFTWHIFLGVGKTQDLASIFLGVGKTQDLASKIWQTLGDDKAKKIFKKKRKLIPDSTTAHNKVFT
jgi:hypothetical protein